MTILLLGNGFDLYFQLPTSYRNFLLTVDFLTKHDLQTLRYVGDVFGHADLIQKDSFIRDSYEKHHDIYNKIPLDADKLINITERAKRNLWFNYFLVSFNRDVGWIDFEKEVAFVISCFKSYII